MSKASKGAKGNKKSKRAELLGVGVKKEEAFGEWYTNVVTRAELLEYYDISGCYILRPTSYAIWEAIQGWFDAEIKKLGVQNAYFPLLVSERALNTEKEHIADFSPEVAWVTRSGQSDLNEPVAIRPTSETIMYPTFARWIRSHRDLPLRINQWSNIVRWEFKDAVPFIRSREFLWQEGHTAYGDLAACEAEVLTILDLYAGVYQDLLAVPVIKGRKSEKEKFAGGDYTTTVEAFIPASGRAVQGATSHHLGQNFSKMFTIEYESEEGDKKFVHQNSWGITTRTIGVMIMVHGDDKGLVIPPRVATTQVVVIPIHFKGKKEEELDAKANEIAAQLRAAGVRVHVDDRKGYNPGFKYSHWEMRGVPLRLEVGPRDLDAGHAMACRRDTGDKSTVPFDSLVEGVTGLLDDVHASMLAKATAERDAHLKKVDTWEEFMTHLNQKCMCLVPWCNETKCEEAVKKRSATESVAAADVSATGLTGAAKTLCIPFEQDEIAEGTMCFAECGSAAKVRCLFGRSY